MKAILFIFILSSCISEKTNLDFVDENFSDESSELTDIIDSGGSSGNQTGTNLYRINCSNCHGVLENSSKKFRNFHQIKNAISNIDAMNTLELRELSDDDIRAISEVLNVTQTTPIDNERLDVSLRLGSRRYVESVFKQIFDITSEDNSDLRNRVFRNKDFGGACDYYAAALTGNSTGEFNNERCWSGVKPVMQTNYSNNRSAHSINTCERVIKKENLFEKAMSKVTATSSDFTSQSFIKLYQLFYLLEVPSNSVIEEFKLLFRTQSSRKEGWRSVLMGVCMSPEWQVL